MSISTISPREMAPEAPEGASVEANIKQAQDFVDNHNIEESYFWFYGKVKNGAEWDYKQQGRQYENFGNWHFGVIGTAMGIPADTLRRLAGAAQIAAGTSDRDQWGHPLGQAPYGDDPADQDAIDKGIEWARANGHEGSMILPRELIRFPMNWTYQGVGSIHPYGINPAVHEAFTQAAAIRAVPMRDPLAIDLDGDGIETVGITATPVFFDHDGSGQRIPTGWLQSDDAWLVLDRNGNGSIDNGTELFGTNTTKFDKQLALSGLDALCDFDSNGDGMVDARDERMCQLQLWQDRNQDGLSQADELSPLAERGISAIAVQGIPADTDLGHGNRIVATAPVLRKDGSATQAADLVLATAESTAPRAHPDDEPWTQASATSAPLEPTASDNTSDLPWWSLNSAQPTLAPSIFDFWQSALGPERSSAPPTPVASEYQATLNNQVSLLIQAMASFSPPPMIQSSALSDPLSAVNSTITLVPPAI